MAFFLGHRDCVTAFLLLGFIKATKQIHACTCVFTHGMKSPLIAIVEVSGIADRHRHGHLDRILVGSHISECPSFCHLVEYNLYIVQRFLVIVSLVELIKNLLKHIIGRYGIEQSHA